MPRHFSPDEAREAQARSVESRLRRQNMSPEQRALDAIGSKMDRLTGELLSAALGEGDFSDLDKKTRVQALIRALEYRLGRPTTSKVEPPREDPTESGVPSPEDLFSRQGGPDAGAMETEGDEEPVS